MHPWTVVWPGDRKFCVVSLVWPIGVVTGTLSLCPSGEEYLL